MDLTDPLIQQCAKQMNWNTIHRVCGELSVSRSVGDADYKVLPLNEPCPDPTFLWPENHNQVSMMVCVLIMCM
mgnify:CR=1 FL=1